MKKHFLRFVITGSILFSFTGCEDWFAAEEEDMVATDNTTYTYKWTCFSGGTQKTIQIPNRLSATCKQAWEFYARTYGCNDANSFAEAERRKSSCP